MIIIIAIIAIIKLSEWFDSKWEIFRKSLRKKKKCKHGEWITLPSFKGHECTKCNKIIEFNRHHFIRHLYLKIFRELSELDYKNEKIIIDFEGITYKDKKELIKVIQSWAWKRYASIK